MPSGGRSRREDETRPGYVGDARLTGTAGSCAFVTRGAPHTFIAETEGATALIGFHPFQFEGFMREVGDCRRTRSAAAARESTGHGAA